MRFRVTHCKQGSNASTVMREQTNEEFLDVKIYSAVSVIEVSSCIGTHNLFCLCGAAESMCCCMRTLLHHSMPNLAIVNIQASIFAELKFYANQQSELCGSCNL